MTPTPSARGDGGRKPIWPLALLATLISIIWAGAYVYGNLSELPPPDGTPFGDGRAVGSWFGATAAAVFLTWLLFHLFAFRKSGTGQSLSVLAIMLAVTTVVVVTPLLSLLGIARQADAIQSRIMEETQNNLAALSERLQTEFASLQLPVTPLDGIHSASDVEASLDRARRAGLLWNTYVTAVEAELESARQRISSAPLSDPQRELALGAFDAEMGPQSLMRRSLALATSAQENVEALLVFLQANNNHWAVQYGSFVFDDTGRLNEFNAIASRGDDIQRQIALLRQEQANAATGAAAN